MATIVFVHGTGVRKASFFSTLAIIRDACVRYRLPYDIEPCLWGDELGAMEPNLSLPDESRKMGQDAKTGQWTEEQEYARWDLLYNDPLFELRLIENQPSEGVVSPNDLDRAERLWSRLLAYQPSETMQALLNRWHLDSYWEKAKTSVLAEEPTHSALKVSTELGEPAQAIARAFVAVLFWCAIEEGNTIPWAKQRDAMVDMLLKDWDAYVGGIGGVLMNFFSDAIATVATPLIKWKRRELSMGAAPAAGDVLLYQVRGEKIRSYIRREVEKLNTDVILLTHSLGGIAAVDLLAMERVPCVKKLITVGSQASLLYEIGALRSLTPVTGTLPDHFPDWLNIYDPYDFLSYLAAPVFESPKVIDFKVQSLQPFPYSHSAYWSNEDTWSAIRKFLK